MKKYKVLFKTSAWVGIVVEAENKEDAIQAAWEEGPSISSYGGNGGWDKLIGVTGHNHSIEADEEFEEPDADNDVFEIN